MKPHIVDFLRKTLNNEAVPEEVHKDIVDLMLEELGYDGVATGERFSCVQLVSGDWIPVTAYAEISSHILDDSKIAAIKALRAATSWGLKDSKDFIERYWDEFKKSGD